MTGAGYPQTRECSKCGREFTACSPKEHLCDDCYFGTTDG